jgi:hypothetical protein
MAVTYQKVGVMIASCAEEVLFANGLPLAKGGGCRQCELLELTPTAKYEVKDNVLEVRFCNGTFIMK